MFTPKQISEFKENGFIIIRAEDIFKPEELYSLKSWTKEVSEWPETPGKWMMYFEKSFKDGSRILQRSEKFLEHHEGMNSVFGRGGRFEKLCSQLFEEDAILYKEKINYKLPGGEGFKPHQDFAAGWWLYGQSLHISVLVGIDEANEENGCLEVVAGEHNKGLFGEKWAAIPPEKVEEFNWVPLTTKPGDVVFFDCFVPHRSAPNSTDSSRRMLYLTYAKESEGDWRERYYADKRRSFPPDCEREKGKSYVYKI